MTNKEFFIQMWESETGPTLSAINGLPSDMSQLSYRHDEKAKNATELLSHFLGYAEVMNNAIDTHVADERSAAKTFNSREEIAEYFESHAKALAKKLSTVDDNAWSTQQISFCFDGHELFSYPMSDTFWMMMFDMIHHRGQLSTYYRHMGVRNPQIYGPTAEDSEAMQKGKE